MNIRTEIEINKIYKNALFKSSCLVSPLGRFTIIWPYLLIYSYVLEVIKQEKAIEEKLTPKNVEVEALPWVEEEEESSEE